MFCHDQPQDSHPIPVSQPPLSDPSTPNTNPPLPQRTLYIELDASISKNSVNLQPPSGTVSPPSFLTSSPWRPVRDATRKLRASPARPPGQPRARARGKAWRVLTCGAVHSAGRRRRRGGRRRWTWCGTGCGGALWRGECRRLGREGCLVRRGRSRAGRGEGIGPELVARGGVSRA